MLSFSSRQHYYLYSAPTDMRKQFDGLVGLVRRHFEQEVMGGDVFVFLNRRRDRIKLLMWDTTGFALYYKRLEAGTFELPAQAGGQTSVELSWSDLVFILEGIALESVKRRKRYQKSA